LLVSIIIPCFNVEDYIAAAIESVLNQNYTKIEIILVDNNSTDSTLKILKEYKILYPKIITLKSEYKQGAPAARNKGLATAKGEWIQFLDADDILAPQKIEHQLSVARKSTDLIVGAWEHKWLDGSIYTTNINNLTNPLLLIFKGNGSFGNTCSNLWRARAIRQIGSWNENLKSSQETELLFRLIINGAKFKITNLIHTTINIRPFGQISQTDSLKCKERFIKVRIWMIKEIKEKKPALYSENSHLFKNEIYRHIRILTNKNFEMGLSFYNQLTDKNRFIPDGNYPDNQLWNEWIVRLIGFYNTEKLIQLYRKIFY